MDNGFAEGYAVGQGNNNAYGGMGAWGADWIWVIVLFALFGWGGNGFGYGGGGNGALTRSDLCQDMNFNNLEGAVRGVQQGLCDGFYAQNTNLLTGFANVQNSLCQGFNATDRAISDLGYKLQDCCCQTQRAIDGVNYNMAKNTCDITNAINGSTQQILGFLTQEKISSLQNENALLTAQLSQNSQTAQINASIASAVSELRPVAKPAYITCSPFESAYGYGRGTNCGGGCGC